MSDWEPDWLDHDGARCAVWYRGAIPEISGEQLGVIGRYECPGPSSGLLEMACAFLRGKGCTRVVGPMDGNTWQPYRFVTDDPSGEPPFFLEPSNPPEYPKHWRDAGFEPYATYRSTITSDLGVSDPRACRIAERLGASGVRLRPIDPTRMESELESIYALSLESFRHNVLYTPLEKVRFMAQYERLVPAIHPQLATMAEGKDGTLVGFCFALPDLCEAQRGVGVRTVVVKTAAVRPGRAWAGLGVHLLENCHATARTLGFTRAIHALMEDGNASRMISEAHRATVLRRYTLFSKSLMP